MKKKIFQQSQIYKTKFVNKLLHFYALFIEKYNVEKNKTTTQNNDFI